MTTIHQFENNPEEDEFYLVEIYWFITYTLVEPSINQQFKTWVVCDDVSTKIKSVDPFGTFECRHIEWNALFYHALSYASLKKR